MNSHRNNPDSEQNRQDTRDNQRAVFAAQQMAPTPEQAKAMLAIQCPFTVPLNIDVHEVMSAAIKEDQDAFIEQIMLLCCESSSEDFDFEKKLSARLIKFVTDNS